MPTADQLQWPQGQPLFEVCWRAVSESSAGNGIQSAGDFNVTATATNLEIQVGTGTALYNGSETTMGTSQTHSLSAGDASNDRWDTVYFDTASGFSGVRQGTEETNPEPPDIQSDEILLAIIYVASGANDVADDDILNWRSEVVEAVKASSYPFGRDDIVTERETTGPHTSNVTTNGEEVLLVDTSGGAVTVTLDASDANKGNIVSIVDVVGSANNNNITIDTSGSENIDGDSSKTIDTNYGEKMFVSDGTNWFSIGGGGGGGGSLSVSGPHTSNYTTSGEDVVLVDTSSGGVSITIASSDVITGKDISIVDVGGSASTNTITILTGSSETIDGATDYFLQEDYGEMGFVSDGTNWFSISTDDQNYATNPLTSDLDLDSSSLVNSSTNVLTFNSSGDPTYYDGTGSKIYTLAAGELQMEKKLLYNTATKTGSAAATDENVVFADSSGGNYTLSIQMDGSGGILHVINIGSNDVTIQDTLGNNINGNTTITLNNQYEGVTLVGDGNEWYTVDNRF